MSKSVSIHFFCPRCNYYFEESSDSNKVYFYQVAKEMDIYRYSTICRKCKCAVKSVYNFTTDIRKE